MQVKKFEARTMKEALEMVKTQLGPDAIILSARDNQRSFGLVGEGSVEITAAVSEETLQRKKFVESRMKTQDFEQFTKTSAKNQKAVIQKMVTKYMDKNQASRPITSRRYADIDDEQTQQQQVQQQLQRENAQAQAQQSSPSRVPAVQHREAVKVEAPRNVEEVASLRGEIASLKEIIARFQNVPQTLSSMASHPGADYGLPFDLSFMFERLTGSGVSAEIAAEILTKAQEAIPALKMKNRNLIEGWVARHILETTKVTEGRTEGKIQIFVGPAGSGKTNAMVKMASHLVVREKKKVALLTADTYKVGAADQMRIYAQILNVPFAVIRSGADWNHLMRYLSSVDVVLVDMPGFSLKNAQEIETLKAMMPPAILNPRVHFVGSSVAKDEDLTEAGRRYSVIGFDDAIFTSLDEAAQHGTIYNFSRRFGVPLHAFGIGPRVPEDFEAATRERVLDLLFRITRNQTPLVEA